jgi:phosphorylcholine metabolism protein LicD
VQTYIHTFTEARQLLLKYTSEAYVLHTVHTYIHTYIHTVSLLEDKTDCTYIHTHRRCDNAVFCCLYVLATTLLCTRTLNDCFNLHTYIRGHRSMSSMYVRKNVRSSSQQTNTYQLHTCIPNQHTTFFSQVRT